MSTQKHLVLIGGGHTHALVLKQLERNPLQNTRITVINPGPRAAYSGMLPGYIAGHYARPDLDLDIAALANSADVEFIMDLVISIDTDKRVISLMSGAELSYDYASIDVGITSELPRTKGFQEHAVSAKPLDQFAQRWQAFMAHVRNGTKPAHIALIGGGVAGAELALAMAHSLRGLPERQISLIDRSEMLIEMHPRTRKTVFAALGKYGVQIFPNTDVSEIEAQSIVVQSNGQTAQTIDSAFTLSAAGARPYDWISQIGSSNETLNLQHGFIAVDPYLRSSNERLFAVGDCAHMTDSPRPKAGVFAVRQAPVLLNNLRCVLEARSADMQAYQPQKDYLKLMSLGDKKAIADKNGLQISGAPIWQLKNAIDHKFMKQFRYL